MRAPQSLGRTDTQLELALDLKYSPLPTPPPTHGPARVLGRPLKRTESYGKGNSQTNALVPTKSMQGSHLLPMRSRRDTIKSANIPVFSPVHEVGDNVGLDFGKWHLDPGEGRPRRSTRVAEPAPLAVLFLTKPF
ncbi:unnamed protein product [Rhizoctonia solani]|uniref:Uncharacterized protein n=1 Tax=Rhizoctonia solani TaxID=456999 RepID=A0A8H3HSC7_9AGAM|nr:unnamed protein product [Rhizoctonia solani]